MSYSDLMENSALSAASYNGRSEEANKVLEYRRKREYAIRDILHKLVGHDFIPANPEWLYWLKLTGYCESENMAFICLEHQHLAFNPKFYASKEEFESQKRQLELKQKLLAEYKTDVILVPPFLDHMNLGNLETFLRKELKNIYASRDIEPPVKLDWEPIPAVMLAC